MSDRNTDVETGELNKGPVEAASIVYYGHLLARNSAGNLVAAADTASFATVGMCHETADNSAGGAGAEYTIYRRGIAVWMDNDATNPVTSASIGVDCYVKDSETVAVAAGVTNNIVAGKVLEIDSTKGVKILI